MIDIAESGKPISMCGKGHVLGAGAEATDQPLPTPREPEPASEPRSRGPKGPFQLPPKEPEDLVAKAKARLQVIDRELERLAGLQKERRKLAAMIAAAEAEDTEDTAALAVRHAVNGTRQTFDVGPPIPLPLAAE